MSITSITNRSGDGGLRAAAGAWDPVEFIETAGTRLAIARRGHGPSVVCLHATGHGARDYELLAERIGDSFEIIAVDWPGQGRSPVEKAAASAARYSEILDELLPQLSEGPSIVVGCSIGAAAAIISAARRPELVRALVLCDTGGLVEIDRTVRFFIGRMTAFFRAGARGARWFPRAFRMYYSMVLAGAPARQQRERIVASAFEIAPILEQSWNSFGRPDADIRSLIPRIDCPTLFAWAKGDRVIPWARNKAAAESFRDVRVEHFDGGHAAFLEDPDRFARVFREFTASLGVAASGSGPALQTGSGKLAASA